jgi:hypothetical protein
MRDPLDVLARYFWPIIGCWGLLVAIALLWIAIRIAIGIMDKRSAARPAITRRDSSARPPSDA